MCEQAHVYVRVMRMSIIEKYTVVFSRIFQRVVGIFFRTRTFAFSRAEVDHCINDADKFNICFVQERVFFSRHVLS